ncbi:hypothetical protein KQI36_10395 [Clostridium senegalense]|uniref:hypothetical protein n=1 Tax=Clostridium senegalense TaxID=1465809 RepID=UPI001C1198D3|nr:hypothetical protein [Clostridium senegalense]MBU5227048.1 hypothetical protein [Clostridium senegalense]
MQLIKQAERNRKLYDDYSSVLFQNTNFGLKIIGAASNCSSITVKSIDINDGIRNSEGSISTVFDKIDSIKDFIEKYQYEKLEYALMIGIFNNSKISIGVFFNSKVIRIGYSKGSNFSSKEFADKLEVLTEQLPI